MLDGWSSAQRVTPQGAVESEQRVELARAVVPVSEEGARELAARYWAEVERSTLGLVRTRTRKSADGERLELRVLGRSPALLAFAPAEISVSEHEVRCRFRIRGGLLARGPRGSLTLSQRTAGGVSLSSTITEFYPRLAARPGLPRWSGTLYGQVQHRLHVWISRRFFRRLVGGPR